MATIPFEGNEKEELSLAGKVEICGIDTSKLPVLSSQLLHTL